MICRRTLVMLLLVLALLTTACGSDRGSPDEPGPTLSAARAEAPPQHDTAASRQYDPELSPQDDGLVDEPTVEEVAEFVEQVDGTSVDVAGRSKVLAASDVVPQDASSQNAQAITAAEAYLIGSLANVDRAWTNWFINKGLSEPLVSYDVITPTEPGWQSNCGGVEVVSDTPNAYYCDKDTLQQGVTGTIFLPAITMLKMWNGDIFGRQSQQAGDFAAAVIVAHEFGHHVQDELSHQNNWAPPNGKYTELLADCFAGNWAADLYYQGNLQSGDFEEAVSALEAIGDHNYFAPDHHGTPEERIKAFQVGYHGVPGGTPGDPANCIQYYWQ